MKNRFAIITILIASAAMLLSGCDQTQEMDGKKVRFTARSRGFISTKTSYASGELIEDNGKKYQRIDWQDGDVIRLYSPKDGNLWSPNMDLQAMNVIEGNPYLKLVYADYKLRAKDDNNDAAISPNGRYSDAKLFNNGDNGLTWTGNTATFYGAYPVSDDRIVPHALDEGGDQHLLMEVKIPNSQAGDSTLVSTMPLLAKTAGVTSGSQVRLDFDPYFSAYEFNLRSKDQDVTITSLTVSAQTGFISGHHYWDLTAGVSRSDLGTTNAEEDRSITVSRTGGWSITSTDKASITIFALPNDLGKITLTIKFTVDGSPATATLYLGDDITFGARQKTRLQGLQVGGVWKIFIAAVGVDEWQEVGTTTLII